LTLLGRTGKGTEQILFCDIDLEEIQRYTRGDSSSATGALSFMIPGGNSDV